LRELGGGTQGLERLEAHRGLKYGRALGTTLNNSQYLFDNYGYFRKDRGTTHQRHHALLVLYARTQHKMTIIPLLAL
jgi:hypothetical protein